ncbi:elongation factor G [Thalassospira sp. MA62]|nr:elongation factor G [Thalassospira sp. MA62]
MSQISSQNAQSVSSHPPHPPRVAALVGPYSSGKTSLLESLLAATGRIHKKGTVTDHNTVGDHQPESRSRDMSTELSIAQTTYLDEEWHFIDCPGSVDFIEDAREAAMIADVAIVVVDPDPSRVMTVAPILKYLDRNRIPHLIFINKTDHTGVRLRDSLEALQSISDRPLVLREIPVRDSLDDPQAITGFVDVVSKRAYHYMEGQPSQLITRPSDLEERESEVRETLLEALADFDDALLEQILEDQTPATDTIYDNLERDLGEDLIVPVFFGSAQKDNGIHRLLKALRHDAPSPAACAHRLGVDPDPDHTILQVFKTLHQPHTGRLSYARVLSGTFHNGDMAGGEKISALCSIFGNTQEKRDSAPTGAIVGLPRADRLQTGDLVDAKSALPALWPDPMPPLYKIALDVRNPGEDVKLTEALCHICDQDRSLQFGHNDDTGQLVLFGQGDIHLQSAVARLHDQYHLEIDTSPVSTGYQETIRKPAKARGRYKKQTGGHGQFGDAEIEIHPLDRGAGFTFAEQVVGGVIPRQYIPAVEKGVRDGLRTGPLGFPVVDLAVTLLDGSAHAVDSSEQAFQMAGRMAIAEALKGASPVLLEPIARCVISIPSDFTSKAQRLVSSKRGQILGFSAKEGWQRWDEIDVQIPASETTYMITELRSLTQGTGFFTLTHSHMQELTGKQADAVIEAAKDTTKAQ